MTRARAAIASYVGANRLQWPHHGAYSSTRSVVASSENIAASSSAAVRGLGLDRRRRRRRRLGGGVGVGADARGAEEREEEDGEKGRGPATPCRARRGSMWQRSRRSVRAEVGLRGRGASARRSPRKRKAISYFFVWAIGQRSTRERAGSDRVLARDWRSTARTEKRKRDIMGTRDRGHTTTRATSRTPHSSTTPHDGDDDDLLRLRARQRAERLLLLLLRASRVRADALVAFAGGMLRPTRTRIGRRPRVRARREREGPRSAVASERSSGRRSRDLKIGESVEKMATRYDWLSAGLGALLGCSYGVMRGQSVNQALGITMCATVRRGRDRRAHAGPGEEERRRDRC